MSGPVTRSKSKARQEDVKEEAAASAQSSTTTAATFRDPAQLCDRHRVKMAERPVQIDVEPLMRMFTAGIGQIVAAMQQQTAALAERQQEQQVLLAAQQQAALQQQHAVFTAQQEEAFREHRVAMEELVRNVTAERPRDAFREIPVFSGNPDEFAGWLAAVNRVREARHIVDAVAITECATKLTGIAREWHDRVGVGQATWEAWQARFREAFAPKMSMLEWLYLVETRSQRLKETAATYILEKSKLLRQCPEPLGEAAYLPHLIRGLNSAELRGALSRDVPATIEALMETIAGMEMYQPASLSFLRRPTPIAATAAPSIPRGMVAYEPAQTGAWPAAPAPAPRATKMLPRPDPALPVPDGGRALVPVGPPRPQHRRAARLLAEIQCYACGSFGHLHRDCPERSQAPGNARAGPAGQVRQ